MIVGMVTVFIILLIVIFGSQGIISIINKIAPEAPARAKAAAAAEDSSVRAVLDAAVSQLTGGRGKIVNVTRIN